MKFLCVYRPGTPEKNDPPTDENLREMGALIGDMARAGVLLATEGCPAQRPRREAASRTCAT